MEQRAQWQVETERLYERGESTEASVSDWSHRGSVWKAREWMKRPQCGVVRAGARGPPGADRDVRCALRLAAWGRGAGERRKRREHAVAWWESTRANAHRQTVVATKHSQANWRRLHRKWQRGSNSETHTNTHTHTRWCTLMAPLKDTQMAGATQTQATGAYLIIIS